MHALKSLHTQVRLHINASTAASLDTHPSGQRSRFKTPGPDRRSRENPVSARKQHVVVIDFLHTHTKKQFYTALLQGLCRIGNRSVVCAASYEARELGAGSGSCQKASLASGPPIRNAASPLAGICVRINLA